MKNSGTYTWFGYLEDFGKKLDAVKNAGFSTVCTLWDRSMEESDGILEEQSGICEKHGLILEHAHLPYYGCNVLWRDTADREELLKIYEDGITAAGGRVRTLVIHPCEVFPPSGGSYETMLSGMKRLCEKASRHNVRLAFENLGENGTVRSVLRDLNDPLVAGLCFDSGHNNVATPGDLSLLEECRGRVFALHIHDNDTAKDRHLLPYSEGCTIDWKRYLAAIRDTGFDGSLMLEASCPVDYEKMDSDSSYVYTNPELPMEDYLREAYAACQKIYREGE